MVVAVQSVDAAAVAALREQVPEICFATAFLVAGLTACAIAALRRIGGVRVFLWLGVWSSAYGVQHLLGSAAVVSALPKILQVASPYVVVCITYLNVIAGCYAWLGLIRGAIRRVVVVILVAASITAVLGIGWFLATGVADKFMLLNNLLAACVLAILVMTVTSKKLFQKYLLLPNRGFLAFGTFVFAAEALIQNLSRPFGVRSSVLFDHLGFAILLIAFGHSALRMVLLNERRLLMIESELDLARQIQSSILPTTVPQIRGLRIAATYRPMTAVAGDFYEFLPVDDLHAGFFVADVCGHGVPAALIASMLKVGVQSVVEKASDPAQLLSGLNRALSGSLRGQLVSAAYLWIDMRQRRAFYSAAGHPPLLHWTQQLETLSSNGLLLGVLADTEYPVREIPLDVGDRLLLYTDGITEPENAAGEAFGDVRLAETLAQSPAADAATLSTSILSELERWQSSSAAQDDRTLIVIDIVSAEANPVACTGPAVPAVAAL